jgi:hypothetical protein
LHNLRVYSEVSFHADLVDCYCHLSAVAVNEGACIVFKVQRMYALEWQTITVKAWQRDIDTFLDTYLRSAPIGERLRVLKNGAVIQTIVA